MVFDEETELKTMIKAAPEKKDKKAKSRIWQSVLVGGVPGILIGASGTATLEAIAAEPEAVPEINDQPGEIQIAHGVNDDMTFSEAFAAARSEVGPGGAFVWHGQVYDTYRADDPEWQEMSAEDRAEHSQLIMSQVHPEPYEPGEDEPEIVPDPAETEEETGDDAFIDDESGDDAEASEINLVGEGSIDGDPSGEVDVHIVGTDTAELENGAVVQVGYGEVDGLNAVFADVDGDGEVDTVLIDVNGNGELDSDEVFDGSDLNLTTDAMQAEAEANSMVTVDDQLFEDMPDYTNDADASSLI